MALQEQSEPFELESKSRDGAGRFTSAYGKFTAHPKKGPETRELIRFAYSAGLQQLNNLIDHGVNRIGREAARRDHFAAPCAGGITRQRSPGVAG